MSGLNHMVYKSAIANDLMSGVESPAMADHLVRVERLKQLQKERGWLDSELARQCGRTPQQVRAWSDPKGRKIGEKLARSLEENLKLPRYYLDERPSPPVNLVDRGGVMSQATAPVTTPVTEPPMNAQIGTLLPVLPWDQLRDMLLHANTDISDAMPVLGTFATTSAVAKFIEMPDDSMEPVFSAGDHILFEPAEVPHAGDTVLVRIRSGEYFVRTFRPRTAHHWLAEPINAHYEPILSTTDEAQVMAVMVEHRRYRKRR